MNKELPLKVAQTKTNTENKVEHLESKNENKLHLN